MSVQVDSGHTQAHEACEEGLLHVGELLEGHVLDDGGQLVVVANHDPPLQAVVAVLWVLPEQRQRFSSSRFRIKSYILPFKLFAVVVVGLLLLFLVGGLHVLTVAH